MSNSSYSNIVLCAAEALTYAETTLDIFNRAKGQSYYLDPANDVAVHNLKRPDIAASENYIQTICIHHKIDGIIQAISGQCAADSPVENKLALEFMERSHLCLSLIDAQEGLDPRSIASEIRSCVGNVLPQMRTAIETFRLGLSG